MTGGFAFPWREVLLRGGALLGELAHHFGTEPGGFRQDVVQSVEYLFELFWTAGGTVVRHSCRKDYRWQWHP